MIQEEESITNQDDQGYQKGDNTLEYNAIPPDYCNESKQVFNDAEKASPVQDQHELTRLPDLKLQDFLMHWLQKIAQPDLQPNSYQYYRELIDLHVIPVLGEIPLRSFLPQQLQQFYQQKHAEGYSVQMIEYLHSILHQVFTSALHSHLVEKNICDIVKPDYQPIERMFTHLSRFDPERVCHVLVRIAMHFEEEDREKLSAQKP
ncbi:hypothetical protein ccbrp13_19920 [Ktedonobacteria bacterium brp13]|nr:hypothetical protein ccbrp13_19920 [Ktedonobacteria bacterium brp13]